MSNILFSPRGVHIWPKDQKDYTALFVPAEDQLTVLRDLSAGTSEIAQRVHADGRIPLWREKRNQIIVYGFLPLALKEIRQSLRVFLAEDFAPKGCSAFFYVFGNWVVHGVKEINEERHETWRSTVLTYSAEQLIDGVADATADLLLRFHAKEICIALDGDLETQGAFDRALQPLEVKVAPFGSLKPARQINPLYLHRDHTLPMIASVAVLALILLAILGSMAFNWAGGMQLAGQIKRVRHQIDAIQVNHNLGYIHEPLPILNSMQKIFHQQPSAIIDAAGRFGRALGELDNVEFSVQPADSTALGTTGILPVTVRFKKANDKLLVNQESAMKQLLPKAPWIRNAASVPLGGSLQLTLMMQIAAPPGSTIPSATDVFQPLLDPPAEALTGPGGTP